jgi:hypothetical protein
MRKACHDQWQALETYAFAPLQRSQADAANRNLPHAIG